MYIQARVYPQSKKSSLETSDGIYFTVRVKEEAKGNQANRKVTELIAEYFHVPQTAVRIVNGHRSPKKLLSITS